MVADIFKFPQVMGSQDVYKRQQDLSQQFGAEVNFLGKLIPFISCMLIGMGTTTSSSLSLEGKNMWILQTLPVPPITVFNSKIGVSLTTTVPAVLVSGILFIISGYLDIAGALFVFITPIAFAVFMSNFGLLLNYYNLNLEWKNEITVIKQSMPTMVTVFVGMLGIMILLPLIMIMPSMAALLFTAGFTVVALVFAFIIQMILAKKPLVKNAD